MSEALYRIQVAAERAGLSEGLIRAWERRYGLVTPQRTPGGYRAYTERDIALLKRLRELTEQGVSIAEAAALAPALLEELRAGAGAGSAPRAVGGVDARLGAWRAGLLEAMTAFDQQRIEAILDEALAALPPVVAFERLLAPVEIEVGDLWHAGKITIAEEHTVSNAIRNRLAALVSVRPRRSARHVVCACLPTEEHELGLLGAALRFQAAGLRVTYLGARTPAEELARVVEATHPVRVALSAVVDPGAAAFKKVLLEVVSALPRGTRITLGGAAARRHAAVAAKAGVELVETDEAWNALLDAIDAGR